MAVIKHCFHGRHGQVLGHRRPDRHTALSGVQTFPPLVGRCSVLRLSVCAGQNQSGRSILTLSVYPIKILDSSQRQCFCLAESLQFAT